MSGPKYYSSTVFDSNVRQIFSLQNQIRNFYNVLCSNCIDDKERNIRRDCSSFVENISSHYNEMIKTFSIGIKGTISEVEYNKIKIVIDDKIEELNTFLSKIKIEVDDFHSFETDYRSFLDYDNYYLNSQKSFFEYKEQVKSYLNEYLKNDNKLDLETYLNKIDQIESSYNKSNFFVGFSLKKTNKINEIQDFIIDRENDVNKLRTELSSKIASEIDEQDSVEGKINELSLFQKTSAKTKEVMDKINRLINSVNDFDSKKIYKEQFDKLKRSKTLTDTFYYKQLFENIKESENTKSIKQNLTNEIEELFKISISVNLLSKKESIVDKISILLGKKVLNNGEYMHIKSEIDILKKKNKEIFENEEIEKREKEFLKNQMINALMKIGYEVVTDTNLIDLETIDDFLMSIPNQNNFIDINFKKDGSFYYNFLIPEDKKELSSEGINNKVKEMEITCSEFKSLIKELSKIGLKIDLKSEIKSSEKAIIQLPPKYKNKIKAKETILRSKKKDLKQFITN